MLSTVAHGQNAPTARIAPPQAAEGWVPTNPEDQAQQAKRDQNRDSRSIVDPFDSGNMQPFTPRFRAGNTVFLPQVTAAAFYDDNVFATNSNRQGSWGGVIRPELGIVNVGPSHFIEGRGTVEDRWYSRFSRDDTLNGTAALNAVVMPDTDTQLVGKARYTHGHEERGSGDSTFAGFDKPVGYNTFEASGAVNRRFNRFWTSLGVAGSWQHYDNPTIGGVPVDQSYRNGVVSVASGRFGYVVAPLTSVFVEVAGNNRNFQVDPFDSSGYRVVGGVLLEPGAGSRVRGEAYAGYMYQKYSGLTFNTVSTFTYGGSIGVLLMPKLTATLEGRRNALESGLNGGVSLVESLVGGRFDYRVLPNLVVGAGASYLIDEFQGAGRTDRSLSPLFSVKYFVNPNVTVGFDYRNVNFDSNGIGTASYYRNVYLLSLSARI